MMRRSSLGAGLLVLAGAALALPGAVPPLAGADDAPASTEPSRTAATGPVSLDGLPEAITRLLQRLPEGDARRLRRRATLWQAWSPEMRDAFAKRVDGWEALDATARVRRREGWQALQALPAEQREQVVGMARAFANMPETEQAALRQRFAALDPTAQRGWLLGPVLGADYPTLHPLLAQLPPDQHAPLLAALQSMTPAERAQLGARVQRTPPQERDALRQALIETPPERLQP